MPSLAVVEKNAPFRFATMAKSNPLIAATRVGPSLHQTKPSANGAQTNPLADIYMYICIYVYIVIMYFT